MLNTAVLQVDIIVEGSVLELKSIIDSVFFTSYSLL